MTPRPPELRQQRPAANLACSAMACASLWLCGSLLGGCPSGDASAPGCETAGASGPCAHTTDEGASSSLPTGTAGETSETPGTDSTSSTSTSEAWPECAPHTASNAWFVVGADQWSAPYDPETYWPPGHHTAVCVVESIARADVPDIDLWNIFIDLEGCTDEGDQPVERSLDLAFASNRLPAPPALVPGMSLRVRYSVKIWGVGDYQSWYSLRAADTDELLLAAVSDPGPTVAPKVPDAPTLEGWLSPLTAALGPFVCPPETEFACEGDDSPQRAALDLSASDESRRVVSGTAERFAGFYVHVGFAGNPDICDLRKQNNPIEFILIRE